VVRDGEEPARVGGYLLRVAAVAEQAQQPAARVVAHDNLAAGDQRQCLLAEIGVLGLVRVGVVDAGGEHVHHELVVAGLRVGQIPHHQGLRAAELRDLDRAHSADRTRR
jgi:hypothetical protein